MSEPRAVWTAAYALACCGVRVDADRGVRAGQFMPSKNYFVNLRRRAASR